MTPIHLILRLISRLHWCCFSVSVWTAGAGVRLDFFYSTFPTLFSNFFSTKTRNGSGFAKYWADLNLVITKLWPAVGKRRDNNKLYIFDNGTAGGLTFLAKSKQHRRLFATVHLRVENLFLHAIAQAPVNVLDTKNLFIEQSQGNLNETQNVTS